MKKETLAMRQMYDKLIKKGIVLPMNERIVYKPRSQKEIDGEWRRITTETTK